MSEVTLKTKDNKASIDINTTIAVLHELYETYIKLQLRSEAKKVNAVIADLDFCTHQDTAKLYAQSELFEE
ncbi:hypothetical protein [Xylocopilactobacillus apis]|uniref:Uncharacterized protein n=1 Tax=Xylocopilactobacillus apis TaxID=2932183 RepID=A0AAU9D307_9LACO|nr:hypothetical protein [Xylocopilactobacillus apis]BDR56891.1 hypothetical protein KIMC2_14530 [Xylocopilactobacillus apis]